MKNKPLLFSMLVCHLIGPVFGQPWSGIIASGRAVDWSTAGVPGGIPSYPACTSAQAGVTVPIAAYTGSAATINTALSKCASANPSGSYLLLAAGTFSLSTGLDMSSLNKVVLRGQGANQTFLVFTSAAGHAFCGGYDAMVCIAPPTSAPGGSEANVCDWTAGYSQGSTSITLSNCGSTTPALGSLSNLKINSIIALDQVDVLKDPGTIWPCTNGPESAQSGSHCAQEANGGVGRSDGPAVNGLVDRMQEQVVRVTNCVNTGGVCTSGANITISPGLYMPNWTGTQLPQAFFATTITTGNGLENLSVDDGNVFNADFNVTIGSCYGCWIKGIRSLHGSRAHFMLAWSSHITLQDNYAAFSLAGGTQSYGVETHFASDSLMQNNIFQQVTGAEPDMTAVGTVAAYNFAIDTVYAVAPGFAQATFYYHSGGDAMNLFEGNIGFGATADDVHGTHHFETLYRNFLTGWQLSCAGAPCASQTNSIILMAGSRYFNIIANVVGIPGYHSQYQSAALSTATGANVPSSIYQLGYTGVNGNVDSAVNGYCTSPTCQTTSYYDPQTTTSLMRWGNWDSVSNAVRWCGSSSDTGWTTTCGSTSEVPSTIGPYSNSIPTVGDTGAGQPALPNSFYLGSKPSWWGSLPWPPIGPDVVGGNLGQCTGGTYPLVAATSTQCTGGTFQPSFGGHVNAIPAMNCVFNVMNMPPDGSGSPLSFNAASCYGGGGPPPPPGPAAPTSLSVLSVK